MWTPKLSGRRWLPRRVPVKPLASLAAYTHDTNPARTLTLLTTWLGHTSPEHTYRHLTAAPERLAAKTATRPESIDLNHVDADNVAAFLTYPEHLDSGQSPWAGRGTQGVVDAAHRHRPSSWCTVPIGRDSSTAAGRQPGGPPRLLARQWPVRPGSG